jgi:photosystem II stability/assembly factor-like uncharacterized protein
MKSSLIGKSRESKTLTTSVPNRRQPVSLLAIFSLLGSLLAACGAGGTGGATATPTVMRFNGFGGANNHGHSLLALPDNVLVLATHYGLFRSDDGGATWNLVAAGSGQPMDGLMTTSMVSSSLDRQRLYVLTQPAVPGTKGTLGLYTSADQGRTWQLAIATKTLGNIYFVAAGNETAEETSIYLPTLGPQGLKVSKDAGQHFSNTGTLPFGRILGLLAIAGAPGELLAYGSEGMAHSSNGGAHWQVIAGVSGGVFGATTSGLGQPIYASGDAGIYASKDGGKTFTLVSTQSSYGSLIASPVQSDLLYGKTGQAIYKSTDGGHSWQALPATKGNLQDLAADPSHPGRLYLSLSYPVEVYRFSQSDGKWSALTPKA